MFDIMSNIAELLFILLEGYCLQNYYENFIETRWKNRYGNKYYIAIVWIVFRSCLWIFVPGNLDGTRIVGKLILSTITLLVMTHIIYKIRPISLFLTITFLAVTEMSFFLSMLILPLGQILFEFWIWCFGKGYFTSEVVFLRVINITAFLLPFIKNMIWIAILYTVLKKITIWYREKDYPIQRTELLFILTPAMVGLLICVLLRTILVTVENEIPILYYKKYPFLLLVVPIILLLSLLSIVCGVKLFQDMIYLNRERNSKVVHENQINTMEEQIREMEHLYAGIRSVKHDMKNQLAVIRELNKENLDENKEIQTYLEDLNQSLEKLEYPYRTGNTVVDTIINMKCNDAINRIPDISLDMEKLLFPEDLAIGKFDIGAILGNALDNAIEACEEQRRIMPKSKCFIRIFSVKKDRMFFLEIENSFDGNVIRKRETEFPLTKKQDKEAHGIGMYNIKCAAEKYHGAVDWEVKDNTFILSVMLQDKLLQTEKSRV